MAEQALEKLKEQLECSICLETYKEPKLLQCFHVYCMECLERLVVKDEQGFTLSCPSCRQVTTVPSNGVSGLKAAFHVNHLLEIRDDLRKALSRSRECDGEDKKGTAGVSRKKKGSVRCAQHQRKEIELFCETCDELICLKCAIKRGKHHSHNYSTLDEVLEKYKDELSAWMDPVERRVQVIKKALNLLDVRSNEISSQRDSLKSEIEDSVAKIHELVDDRKAELIDNLNNISENKLSLLASQREKLEANYTQLSNSLDFVKADLGRTPSEILQLKNTISSLIKYLASSLGVDACDPVSEADIIFTEPAEANYDAYKRYGDLYAFGSCDISRSYASGGGLSSAMVGEEASITIHTVNHLGEVYIEPIKNLRCELLSNINGAKVTGKVEGTGKEGKIEIRYRPAVKGRSYLHVVINNQPIQGSPFSVLVDFNIQKLSSPVLIMKGAMCPWGMAVSEKEDKIVVSDFGKQCISVFSRSFGIVLKSFEKLGSVHRSFKSPRGVSRDKNSNMFVADSGNHRIQKFTLDGNHIASVGSMGTGPLQFYFPKDVAYNFFNDKIYIVDGNNQVQVLNSDLSLSGIFGKHGKKKEEFDNPWGIACDDSGRVYVADTYNHRVQVFTADMEFVTMFGSRGKGEGELMDPISIAVNSSKDVVYVSERQNQRVSIFSTGGKFITSSAGEGHKCGLAVDSDGLVYVCNISRGQIQVF